jgi:glycosyltransferase involved in cell wall biosynthesis
MKVNVVHPSLNGIGGSEQVCLSMIESLKENGYAVSLGTFEKTDWENVERYFPKIRKPDNEIVKPRLLGTFAYGEMVNFLYLESKMPKDACTTVVSCTSPWFYCPSTPRAVIYLLPPLWYDTGLHHSYLKPYVFIQRKHLGKENKVLLTNSSFSAKIIKKVYSVEPNVLYPPVNIEDFHPSYKEDLIVSVGRFDPLKRFEVLVEAFKGIGENAKCAIIGSSAGDIRQSSRSYIAKLKRIIVELGLSDRVELLVNCPFSKLVQTLSKAKIYVHCFQNEPFGISVVESMAAGCVPVVHRSVGAYYDIIDCDKYGLSFEGTHELSERMSSLLNDAELCKQYQNKALERARLFDKSSFKKRFMRFV